MSLEEARDILKFEQGNCNHKTATVQLSEYLWTCDCGQACFMKAIPELKRQYEDLIKRSTDNHVEISEMFGIKIVRTKA